MVLNEQEKHKLYALNLTEKYSCKFWSGTRCYPLYKDFMRIGTEFFIGIPIVFKRNSTINMLDIYNNLFIIDNINDEMDARLMECVANRYLYMSLVNCRAYYDNEFVVHVKMTDISQMVYVVHNSLDLPNMEMYDTEYEIIE